jgi:succinyl-CoA synthetase alpha subunit
LVKSPRARRSSSPAKLAAQKGVAIIDPATAGGLKPSCFKICKTGGMLDNVLVSKLYRAGSMAYVSRSGGNSNELISICKYPEMCLMVTANHGPAVSGALNTIVASRVGHQV